TGVSDGPDFSKCASYISKSIKLKNADGVVQTVSFSVLQPPMFTGPAANTSLPFTPSVSSSQTITATGNPTPAICYSSSNPLLTADFSANGAPLTATNCTTNGSFQLQFNGNPSAIERSYNLTVAASNGIGANASRTFTIDVSPHLMITSPSALS